MEYFVKAFGIFIIAVGAINFVNPAFIRKFIDFAKVGNRFYIGGAVRVVIGILLLISIPSATAGWIPAIIGILILASGITIFVLGKEKIHSFMDWLYNMSDQRLRIPPIVAIIFGILLIYSV